MAGNENQKRIGLKRILVISFFSIDLLFLCIFLLGAFLPRRVEMIRYPELLELTNKPLNFSQLKIYFANLANKKGAVYAYEVLKKVPVAPNTDMHLLGHVVGEVLYKQKGAEGIKFCTQDFRNACSHTIVVGLFTDKGVAALPEIAKACEKAPGGKGAYGMCFHGLGHGVLAFTGYDLPKTIELCSKTATKEHDRQEFPQCVGGAIMEIITGGDHDKALWTQQSQKYLTTADPLYPCTADYMPAEVQPMCYVYLTPHLYLYAGASLAHPSDDDFKKAFTYCNALPKDTEQINRNQCYGGFGKEFIVLAKGRDIRSIDSMNQDEIQKVVDWCSLADAEDGKQSCLMSALSNMYWGGENKPTSSLNLCNLLSTERKKDCYQYLVSMIIYYKGEDEKKKICLMITNEQPELCKI